MNRSAVGILVLGWLCASVVGSWGPASGLGGAGGGSAGGGGVCSDSGVEVTLQADVMGWVGVYEPGSVVIVPRTEFECLFIGPPGWNCDDARRWVGL